MEIDDPKKEHNPKEGGMVGIVCAWCGAGQEKVQPGDKVSHGICEDCAKQVERQIDRAESRPGEEERTVNEDSFHTPEPWTVEPDPYGCGRYQIRERIDEEHWVEQGYEISDEEGDRREEIANLHNRGNSRLIERSLSMFNALAAMAGTKVDENSNHAEILALFMAMARIEVGQILNHLQRGNTMDYQQKAAEVWQGMDENEKTGVRVGLFPAGKMREVEAEGYDSHKFCLALMDQAKVNGGMMA